MSLIPLPYQILAVALALLSSFGAGWHYRGNHEQAIRDKAALAASQEATNNATKTTDILGTLLAVPELGSDADVAVRLLDHTCDSGRVPSDASGPRSPSPAAARHPLADQNRKLAGELKQCVRLAGEFDALRAIWHANEVHK